MFRLDTDLSAHLRRGGTLVVPTRQRLRAVQLAYAAAELAAGRKVWGSPDVLTPAGLLRREAERLAGAAADPGPRVLSAAEEWLLWRESAAQAASGAVFLDHGALAQSLQRASELSCAYHLRIPAAPRDSEAGLLYEAQRFFDARARALRATSVAALGESLLRCPPGPHRCSCAASMRSRRSWRRLPPPEQHRQALQPRRPCRPRAA